jgi:hypothetical protein
MAKQFNETNIAENSKKSQCRIKDGWNWTILINIYAKKLHGIVENVNIFRYAWMKALM